MSNHFITDFSNPLFQTAFKSYFEELGIKIKHWDLMFKHMNEDKEDVCYLRTDDENNIIGFIQFKKDELKNWFFTEKIGFIRELWINPNFRGKGQAKSLIELVEKHFIQNEKYKSILTTDTAPLLYIKCGYIKDQSYIADNEDDVYIKLLK